MEKVDINKFLPFGSSLKEVLQHTSFKGVNAKQLLREKGVFLESNEEEDTFPLLTTTLLSPFEFEIIKEKIKIKEDSEKVKTRSIPWNSDNTLIQSVPLNLDLNTLLNEENSKYKVVAPTNFAMIENNPNKIKMTFKCETDNFNSSWYRTKNEFKGELLLERIKNDDKVYIQLIYTSSETMKVSDKIATTLVSHFKEKNLVDANKEEERILYKNFTNSERIQFLLSLTSDSDVFSFNKISDIVIGPDPNEILPDEFNWMNTGRVKELIVKGDILQESVFLKEYDYYKYLELGEVEVLFGFKYYAAEGNCKLRYGFENFFKKRHGNIEFQVEIDNLNLDVDYAHVSKGNVRRFLLQEFQKLKSSRYNKFLQNKIGNKTTVEM